MFLITCYAKLNFHFSDLRSLLPCRDTDNVNIFPCTFSRNDIGADIEKAYENIGFSEAARMLFFETQKPMTQYAQEVSC